MGWHARQGVFMAYGPDIKRERLSDLKIYDITPTILHMLGVPVPGDVDGRVLTEIFKPESKAGERPVVYQRVDERRRVMVKIKQLKNSGRI
jgi:arylsulfatase A-like enzyme